MKDPLIDNYIIQVTADSKPFGITLGFLVNKEAFDALKDKHNFVFQQDHFKHCSDTEFYRIKDLTDMYLKGNEAIK